MATILQSPFFVNLVLPFILVFTVVFAILQKSEILGKGKKQVDSLVALAIALITVSFANAVGIINSLMPFLAVSAVIILVLMLLVGMVGYKDFETTFKKEFRLGVTIVAVIAVVAATLVATGGWDYILEKWVNAGNGSELFTNIVFVILIGLAAWLMLKKEKKKEGE